MKYFSSFFVVSLLCVNSGNCAYLPVVDVSRGDVSARALFGEEIVPQKSVATIEHQKNDKKVVARSATKKVAKSNTNVDVLKPSRPSSDL